MLRGRVQNLMVPRGTEAGGRGTKRRDSVALDIVEAEAGRGGGPPGGAV